MQRLPLKLLEPGMVVARQIVNEKGAVLVSQDTELTERLISRLEDMNVGKVAVKGCPVDKPGYAPKRLKDRLADVETGFSRTDPGDELMKKFKVVLKAHFIKRDEQMRAMDDQGSQPAAAGPPASRPAR